MSALISEILETAQERGREKGVIYEGELLPQEAYTLQRLRQAPASRRRTT
jgi:hypothetical protein